MTQMSWRSFLRRLHPSRIRHLNPMWSRIKTLIRWYRTTRTTMNTSWIFAWGRTITSYSNPTSNLIGLRWTWVIPCYSLRSWRSCNISSELKSSRLKWRQRTYEIRCWSREPLNNPLDPTILSSRIRVILRQVQYYENM